MIRPARDFCLLILLHAIVPANFVVQANADITLPKIFSDHMVLQRNSDVGIWGQSEPTQKLVITFGEFQQTIIADDQGYWSTTIETADAGGPFQLEIAAEAGEPKVVFSDVMVGEVWLCSGQSNMEWPVSQSLDAETEIQRANQFPNLRLFTVGQKASPEPLDDFAECIPWQTCSSESVGDFSAVAYFYGRALSEKLDGIPIGLIDASWGGTSAEAWTSRAGLESVPELQPLLDYWSQLQDPMSKNRPANLYNGMIAPLTPFQIRGVIWYQGERNNGRGSQYATLLPTLIKDWRTSFDNRQMPFYFAQIAPYRYKNRPAVGLAEIWDAQLKTFKSVPHTGMAPTMDVGNLQNIHPKNKQPVGERLARIALSHVYRDQLSDDQPNLVSTGPTFDSMTTLDDTIRITFQNVGEGLKKRSPDKPLEHFLIAGEDQKWVPATATIDGNSVDVRSDAVKKPVAVRFGWTDTAQPNLVNSAGLPAFPFRTDDFPLESEGKHF